MKINIEARLRNVYTTVRRAHANFELRRAEKALKNCNSYSFQNDWVTKNYENWDKWLASLKGKENLSFLEIGSFDGRSAVWFLNNILTHSTARLTCIDPMFGAKEPRFMHNIRHAGAANKVSLIKKFSDEALPYLKADSFDFIYVDGSHSSMNVLADAIYGWQLLKKNGLMLFDDYLWEPDKPKHLRCQYAIDLFLAHFENKIQLIHKDWQVLVRRID